MSESKRLWLTVFLLLFGFVGVASAQNTIRGIVTEAETGTPLPGVNVYVKGTTTGTATGADGTYQVNVPASADSLVFSYIGFMPQTVAIGGRTEINIALNAEVTTLEELVVVGYGVQEKVNLTGSVAQVNVEELESRPFANVSEALQGTMPGLTVVDRGGRPGDSGTMFFIRGRGTPNNATPLILIDGVPGDINAIDPTMIENISVLKDAASGAIYGSRAANGVILVTTRRGKGNGKINVSYNGYYATQDLAAMPEQVGPEDYMRLVNEAYVNAGAQPKYSEDYIQKTLSGTDPLHYPVTDWIDTVFNPAPMQDHSLSFNGGSQLASFALTLNYMDQKGMIPQTEANRYGFRLNTDFHPSDKLTAGVDVAMRRTWNVEPNNMGSVLWNMFHDTPMTTVAKYPDGTYGWSENGNNPLAYAEAWGRRDRWYTHGQVSTKADYQLLPSLAIRTLASVQSGNYTELDKRDEYYGYDYWDKTKLVKSRTPNSVWNNKNSETNVYLRAMLDFNKTIGVHSVTAILGYDQTKNDWEEVGGERSRLYSNDFDIVNMGDVATDNNWGGRRDWALRSGFGRLNYTLMDRYLFEANFRYDGSSRFPKENRFGFFPSVSAGWRLSQEPFFQGLKSTINEFKLRGSWGKVGDQQLSEYEYWSTYSLGNSYVFGNALVPGATKSAVTNPDITWETTTSYNIGFDAEFWKGKLALTADLYQKNTDDILGNRNVPWGVGLSASRENLYSVRNRGVEVSGLWRDNIGSLNYSVNFQVSHNQNEVTDLAGTGKYVDWIWLRDVGYAIGTMYGYEAEGLFQNAEEVAAHAYQNPKTGPGDIMYKDQNGDGVINADDRVVIGDDMPRYTYGSTWTAAYKGFDLSLFWQGAAKVNTFLQGALVEGPYWENYTTTAWLDHWTPENPDASMPRIIKGQTHNHESSSFWVRDASYLKLKNAQIGYTLPRSLVQRFNASNLRIYVSGTNLLTFTPLDLALDPESPSGRMNNYPQTRTISIGASLNF